MPIAPTRPYLMSREEARSLTDEVKADAQSLWRKLLRLYEGNAHEALGYKSWHGYYAAEFGGSKSHSYRLLNAARVLEELHPPTDENGNWQPHSTALGAPTSHQELSRRHASPQIGDSTPATEGVARELIPVLHDGADAVREAWEETVQRHGPEPTAKQTREVVRELTGKPPVAPREPSWAARMRLLAGELRTIAASPPGEGRDDHCAVALGLVGDVERDLRDLLPETR